jgi:hypothetical protein
MFPTGTSVGLDEAFDNVRLPMAVSMSPMVKLSALEAVFYSDRWPATSR